MGFFDKKNNNNGYTDLSGMNLNSYQQPYDRGQYGGYGQNDYPKNNPYDGYARNAYPTGTQYGYGNQSALSLSDFTRKVYLQMFIGLVITFGIGLFAVLNPETIINLIGGHIEAFLIMCGIEVLLVFVLGFFIEKMNPATAAMLFYAYSIVNGITIAPVLVLYDMGTVFWAFAVTAGIFGGMTLAGFLTKTDLSKLGPILFFGLIGLIIFSVIAMIFAIPMSDLIISVIGIILFMGFTMYDTKKIKMYYQRSAYDPQTQSKYAIVGALQLYLDFINLFLYILRLFARNRN